MTNPLTLDADDADDEDENEEEGRLGSWEGKALLLRLLELCAHRSRSDMVKAALCKGAFDGAGKDACINCRCSKCGFDKLWSGKDGLRRFVVDAKGNIRADAPVEFSSQVKWMRIISAKKSAPGEAKKANYESRTGTVVELLDEFERDVCGWLIVTSACVSPC